MKWDEETDYLFLRNNVPNMAKLRGKIITFNLDIAQSPKDLDLDWDLDLDSGLLVNIQLNLKLDCSQTKAEEGMSSLRLWLSVAEYNRGDEPQRHRSPVDLSETLIFVSGNKVRLLN